jgi:hypothetical protein
MRWTVGINVGVERGAWHGSGQCVGAKALRKRGGFMTIGSDIDIITLGQPFSQNFYFNADILANFCIKASYFAP